MWTLAWLVVLTLCVNINMCFIKYTKSDLQQIASNQSTATHLDPQTECVTRSLNIYQRPFTRRGHRAGSSYQRHIPIIVSNRPDQDIYSARPQHGINRHNLTTIKCQSATQTNSGKLLDFTVLNTRSVNNKALKVKDFVVRTRSDILALTETWLKGNQDDEKVIKDLCPEGFKLPHEPRLIRRGGGVGLLHHAGLRIIQQELVSVESFEYTELVLKAVHQCYRIVVLYRPPNKALVNRFFHEFATLLEQLAIAPGDLILTGDFNFHIDDDEDSEAKQFMALLESFSLKQHVKGSTHKNGHTLDLLITRSTENCVSRVHISKPMLSDHFAIHFRLSCAKPPLERKTIQYRKWKSIDIDAFKEDIRNSPLYTHRDSCLDGLVNQYNDVLGDILDKHAPVKTCEITIRPRAPWYTEECLSSKRKMRQLERRYSRTGLSVDLFSFELQCASYHTLLYESRVNYYSNIVSEHQNDQKALFKVVNKLFHRSGPSPLPRHESAELLANMFADFFVEKIEKIRQQFDANPTASSWPCQRQTKHLLTTFPPVTEEHVEKLIKASATKSCSLDPIPTWLLKTCLNELLPIITEIVNLSLSSATFPENLKEAIIIPLLKKLNLDPDILKHFRPVSNLRFISKLVERVVAEYVQEHMTACNLHVLFQSAYKKRHSTETALVRVQNDLLMAVDRGESAILILLDLSAAFDTVDHCLLLETLQYHLGVSGSALEWFQSYLSDRSQSVVINGSVSRKHDLNCGVPQGSVLGPLLFTIYTSPLTNVLGKHNISYHLYADDTQLYLTFQHKEVGAVAATKEKLESCLADISGWMASRKLKLNGDKTEMLYVHSRFQKRDPFPSIVIGNDQVSTTNSARNIGVIIDVGLTMEQQVSAICQQAFFHLRNISQSKACFTRTALLTVTHAFVTSKLDFGNAMLCGLPKYLTDRLQHVQNSAAKMVTGSRKFDHNTPILRDLHWLPVPNRICFKILLLTYKCMNGLAPDYLADILHKTRTVRSADRNLLIVPKTNLVHYGDRAFSRIAPLLWNNLPKHVRDSPSVDTFKSRLKTVMCDKVFGVPSQ